MVGISTLVRFVGTNFLAAGLPLIKVLPMPTPCDNTTGVLDSVAGVTSGQIGAVTPPNEVDAVFTFTFDPALTPGEYKVCYAQFGGALTRRRLLAVGRTYVKVHNVTLQIVSPPSAPTAAPSMSPTTNVSIPEKVSAEDKEGSVNESNAGLLALLIAIALAICCLFICVIVGTIASSAMYVQNKKQRQVEHEFANVNLEDLLMQGSKGRMLFETEHSVGRGPPVGQLWSPGGERDINASAQNPLRGTSLGHMAFDGDVHALELAPLPSIGGDQWIDDNGTFVGGSRHQGGGFDLESMMAGGANPIYDNALGASTMDLSASHSNPLREQLVNTAARTVDGRGPAEGQWRSAIRFDGDVRNMTVMNPAHRGTSLASVAFDGNVRALKVARRKSISINMEEGTFGGGVNPARRGSMGLDAGARERTSSQFSGANTAMNPAHRGSMGLDAGARERTSLQFSGANTAMNPGHRGSMGLDGPARKRIGSVFTGANEMVARTRQPSIGLVPSKGRARSQFAGANPLNSVAFDGSVRKLKVARRRSISIMPVETAKVNTS